MASTPSVVKIVQKGARYQLLRNGQPYYIKGAVLQTHPEEFAAAGGNSIRSFGPEVFDVAEKNGLTVLAGLPVGSPRQGFNYGDPEQVRKQRANLRQTVNRYKNSPALLMWALGNELEIGVSADDRRTLWKNVDELASMVKQIDPNHPVIVVIAGTDQRNLRDVGRSIPNVDAIGINVYGGILQVSEQLSQIGFTRPYLITEFGPRGHWEVGKTRWGLPIEETSTQKAEFYLRAYQQAISNRPYCLGSYVFLWGNKQEKTHTWYGMFLPDGTRLAAVDVMQYAWTGKWPRNRCPVINGQIQTDRPHLPINVFDPGARVRFTVEVFDPDNDPVEMRWDLRKDVSDDPSIGGDQEAETSVISLGIGSTAQLRMPNKPGNYRVFVYVRDGGKRGATANLPIRVSPPLK